MTSELGLVESQMIDMTRVSRVLSLIFKTSDPLYPGAIYVTYVTITLWQLVFYTWVPLYTIGFISSNKLLVQFSSVLVYIKGNNGL